MRTAPIIAGSSFPPGPTVSPHGVNFSLFSKSITAVDLLLFDHMDDPKPERGRRALRVHLGQDVSAGLAKIEKAIERASG